MTFIIIQISKETYFVSFFYAKKMTDSEKTPLSVILLTALTGIKPPPKRAFIGGE